MGCIHNFTWDKLKETCLEQLVFLTLKISSARCLVLAMVCGFPFSSYRITPSNIFQCIVAFWSFCNSPGLTPSMLSRVSMMTHISSISITPLLSISYNRKDHRSFSSSDDGRPMWISLPRFSHLWFCLLRRWPWGTLWSRESRFRQNQRFGRFVSLSLMRCLRQNGHYFRLLLQYFINSSFSPPCSLLLNRLKTLSWSHYMNAKGIMSRGHRGINSSN